MEIHKTQAAVVGTAIVAVLAEPSIQAAIPPRAMVWVLLITNLLSALLPKIAKKSE